MDTIVVAAGALRLHVSQEIFVLLAARILLAVFLLREVSRLGLLHHLRLLLRSVEDRAVEAGLTRPEHLH